MLKGLTDKSTTKKELYLKVVSNFDLLPTIIDGVHSPKPAIRYGCGSILMDLSEKHPDKLYPYMDVFIGLLESKYRILTWNAMAIIANLTRVDAENKFDAILDKYYSLLNDEYMVTVANVIGNSAKIASAKPHLIPEITKRLLNVEDIHTTPHLTEECKRVIAEKAIQSLSTFFDKLEAKQRREVLTFAEKHLNSPRKTLRKEAADLIKKWSNQPPPTHSPTKREKS